MLYYKQIFLSLLCGTNCPVILTETSTSWKEIQLHRRNSDNHTKPIPVAYQTILRDLDVAQITRRSQFLLQRQPCISK